MPPFLASAFRVCCVAAAFSVLGLNAADPQPPSLIGISREQVLRRLGEPRSNIVAGAREVLFFPRQRIVLRENVVIEVEQLPAEAPRRPSPPTVEPVPAPIPGVAGSPPPLGTAAASAPIVAAPPPERITAPTPELTTAVQAAESVNADAPLVIKSVRPAGAVANRATPVSTRSVPPAPAAKAEPGPAAVSAPAEKTAPPPKRDMAFAAAVTPPTAPIAVPESTAPATESAATLIDSSAGRDVGVNDPPTAVDGGKANSKAVRPQVRGEVKLPEQKLFTTQTYVSAFCVIASVGYLFWRRRQRQIEMAASALSNNPFVSKGPAMEAHFTAKLLSDLEWKRFEELVASYYGKTGVVAVRTKTGPASPVHVRISWKGEPRPFACVQCIAQPKGLIDAQRLQELFQVLSSEDIRRGYVVSSGKFSVGARDFAEEKHITLLSGELFLEKLNALPDTARNDLMQEITTGDYTTPCCPKCEAKMVRLPDDPAAWRCAEHTDVLGVGKV